MNLLYYYLYFVGIGGIGGTALETWYLKDYFKGTLFWTVQRMSRGFLLGATNNALLSAPLLVWAWHRYQGYPRPLPPRVRRDGTVAPEFSDDEEFEEPEDHLGD